MKSLMPTRVVAEAILGRVELSISELEELAVGDVLVLDRSIAEAVEFRLSGNSKVIGHGRIQRNNGRIAIEL